MRGFRFKCEVGCDRVFNSRFNVRKHITLEHPDHKLQCGLCDYTAAISMDLSKYVHRVRVKRQRMLVCVCVCVCVCVLRDNRRTCTACV